MKFADPKSRKQVAVYRLHELHAARWRNAKNIERWNDACRSAWELDQIGKKQPQPPVDFEELPA